MAASMQGRMDPRPPLCYCHPSLPLRPSYPALLLPHRTREASVERSQRSWRTMQQLEPPDSRQAPMSCKSKRVDSVKISAAG